MNLPSYLSNVLHIPNLEPEEERTHYYFGLNTQPKSLRGVLIPSVSQNLKNAKMSKSKIFIEIVTTMSLL